MITYVPSIASKMQIGNRVIATDQFGNYTKEPGIVTGFETNLLGQPLVMVKLDIGGRPNCFYEEELTLEPSQDKQPST